MIACAYSCLGSIFDMISFPWPAGRPAADPAIVLLSLLAPTLTFLGPSPGPGVPIRSQTEKARCHVVHNNTDRVVTPPSWRGWELDTGVEVGFNSLDKRTRMRRRHDTSTYVGRSVRMIDGDSEQKCKSIVGRERRI
ncbi:hypothetical protein THAOC_05243 [Thalassiosira oceanica]|uniref:Uncharacterized protein n=1 Tax=Thalassiosira oceanica TaxID=159749 RepID=K0T643_THAOC|nr:hypothetical protein THAOC_05243 [Thalassiosira oceanica]|eukprot:EJK73150.1 hypothetical protein THAOC_05243 [Thalassiosira oceanica]